MVTLPLFDFLFLGSNPRMKFSSYIIYLEGKNEGENPKCSWWFLTVFNLYEIKFIAGLVPPSNYPKDLLQSKLHGCLYFYFVLFYTKEKCHLKLHLFFFFKAVLGFLLSKIK